MQKENIEIEVDNKTNPWKWVALILIGLMLLDLSCFVGALTGGLAGYALGHKSPRSYRIMPHDFDFPMIPEMPEYPRVPPMQPRLDIPSFPELGSRPRLGVTFVMTDEGAEIVGVVPESPAEQVGVLIGDVITKVNERRVTREQPLNEHIMQYNPGDIVILTIQRDGRTRQIDVRLAAEPQG